MGFIAKTILKSIGWKMVYSINEPVGNCILIVAPHTSLWDFILGRIALSSMNHKGKFLIKKEMFRFPFKHLLTWFGGIPVDRGHGNRVVKPLVEIINKSQKFFLIITPEGTRARTENWKKGYYFIAMAAQVPILLGYIDYTEKVCCISKVLHPSGNYEEDFKIIQDFYRGRKGRHPERFNLS